MKSAADFREIARNALRGRWPVAVLTGFVASLMGAGIATDGGGSSNSNNDSSTSIVRDVQDIEIWPEIRTFVIILLVVLVVWVIVTVIISGAAKIGYAVFNLKLVDHKEVRLSDLFSQFHRLGTGFGMNLFMAIFLFLWSLLLIIPGIIKSYSYAMTPYILAEHPELDALEAITESRRIMDGKKFELFWLQLSFIGWTLLCAAPTLIALWVITRSAMQNDSLSVFLWMIPCSIPTMIGNLFLTPYKEAAYAAFYRDISVTVDDGCDSSWYRN